VSDRGNVPCYGVVAIFPFALRRYPALAPALTGQEENWHRPSERPSVLKGRVRRAPTADLFFSDLQRFDFPGAAASVNKTRQAVTE